MMKPEALAEPVARETLSDDDEAEMNDELPWLWQEPAARQELRYLVLDDVGTVVTGSQRATLPAGQLTAIVHTVFHPPFDAVPEVTIDMQEPDGVTIKAAQVLPHGIRWELRGDAAENSRDVQWAFSASATTIRDPRG